MLDDLANEPPQPLTLFSLLGGIISIALKTLEAWKDDLVHHCDIASSAAPSSDVEELVAMQIQVLEGILPICRKPLLVKPIQYSIKRPFETRWRGRRWSVCRMC
jgi:hypothetical protein